MFKYLLYSATLCFVLASCQSKLNMRPVQSIADLCDKTEKGKPALIYFTYEGCDLCDVYELKILSNPEVIKYINQHFTFYKIDAKQDARLNKIACIYSFPMFAIIAQGELKVFLPTSKSSELFLFALQNYPKQPLEYNILKFVKTSQEASQVAKAVKVALQAACHIERDDSIQGIIDLLKESTEACPYFYNQFALAKAYEKTGQIDTANFIYSQLSQNLTSFDEFVYADEIPVVLSKRHQLPEGQKAHIKFKETTFDFGEIPQDKETSHNFVFQNTSEVPLLIYSVVSTCGCAVADYPKHPVLPRQTDTIKVVFDAKNQGVFNKAVFIMSNAENKRVALNIKGQVR